MTLTSGDVMSRPAHFRHAWSCTRSARLSEPITATSIFLRIDESTRRVIDQADGHVSIGNQREPHQLEARDIAAKLSVVIDAMGVVLYSRPPPRHGHHQIAPWRKHPAELPDRLQVTIGIERFAIPSE